MLYDQRKHYLQIIYRIKIDKSFSAVLDSYNYSSHCIYHKTIFSKLQWWKYKHSSFVFFTTHR
ncbi:hypothetical protein BN1007_40433 [Klebsiella variicola]|nr:hypothetical protein BN1007_40433 [Klebsiella variicola]CTQ24495.1 hypothetical protein BN1200_520022 [Klebsiella variicola]